LGVNDPAGGPEDLHAGIHEFINKEVEELINTP